MDNLILVTSVINTPNIPLSYSNIRSVFSRQDRFEQTKKTIQSVKQKLPNNKIMIVECSDFNEEENRLFEWAPREVRVGDALFIRMHQREVEYGMKGAIYAVIEHEVKKWMKNDIS